MRRSYNPNVPDTRTSDCLEITRRLYRGITDIAKRLDEQKGCALAITDIFTPSGEVLRAKLKDYCERLIFKDPIGHARKTEELLWRKGFYDAVSTAKKLRKGNVWSETEKALLSCHLAVGVGYYHHLILKLQLECDLDLSGVIDFAYPRHKVTSLSSQKSKISQNKILHSNEIRQCAIKIIHRSLVCLGDLARYRLDLEPNWDSTIATRYYKIAVSIDPNIGMPHNQLGTMAGNKNHGLDAVYHYTRCILCAESFDGAEGNLKRIVAAHSYTGKEKNTFQKFIAKLFSLLQLWESGKSSDSERINRDCQDLLVEFENCLSVERKETNIEKCKIDDEDSIDGYLMNFKNEQTSHLNDEMIFKIFAICLMSIAKLQSRESTESQGAIAFTLTIFSQLMEITITRLQQAIIAINPSNVIPTVADENSQFFDNDESPELELTNTDNEIVKESVGSSDDDRVDFNDNRRKKNVRKNEKTNGIGSNRRSDKKLRDKSKSLLTKLRRPRKRLNSSDSDASEIDGEHVESSSDEINSNISETEEEDDILSDCNGISDDRQSDDMTDDEAPRSKSNGHDILEKEPEKVLKIGGKKLELVNEKKIGNIVNIESKNENNGNSDSAVTVTTTGNSHDEKDSANMKIHEAQLRKKNLSPNEIIDILGREGSLQSIKICFDWLRGNPEIFRMFAKSSGASLIRVATLLNLVNVNDFPVPHAESERDFGLTSSEEKLCESVVKVPLPEDIDLRGLKLLDEAHKTLDWRVLRHTRMHKNEEILLRARKIIDFGNYLCGIEDSGIKYDETRKIFITTDVKNLIMENKVTRRNGVDVETEHSKGKLMRHMGRLWLKAEVRALESRLRSRLISPYLVPDQEALAKHTPALKRLVYAKKFIVIIPSVVVSALDEMKRTSSKAREATRWLEGQLRKGSRFLRAQRPHERLPLPLIKGPKTKDKEAWLFFQIIECCHYLTQQTKVGLNGDKEPPVVTLLTGFSLDERKASNFSPDGLSKTAGVNLEHIETFHTKWKTSSKSHG